MNFKNKKTISLFIALSITTSSASFTSFAMKEETTTTSEAKLNLESSSDQTLMALNEPYNKSRERQSTLDQNGTLKAPPTDLIDDSKFIYKDKYSENSSESDSIVYMEDRRSEPIFNEEPVAKNIMQGNLNDCGFLSALSTIAERDSNIIKNCIIDNQDGTVTVRFYDDNCNPKFYRISKFVPPHIGAEYILWVKLFEKAYAVHINQARFVDPSKYNYEWLDRLSTFNTRCHICGIHREKDIMISNTSANKKLINPQVGEYSPEALDFFRNEIKNKLNSRYCISAGTPGDFRKYNTNPEKLGLRPSHIYGVIEVKENVLAANGKKLNLIVLYNPHGRNIPHYVKDHSSGEYRLEENSRGCFGYFNIDLNDYLNFFSYQDCCKLPVLEEAQSQNSNTTTTTTKTT